MRITCPYCGERAARNSPISAPPIPGARPGRSDAGEAWHAYVYLRDNPAGQPARVLASRAGCRRWLIVTRDTRTHAINPVALARSDAGGAR